MSRDSQMYTTQLLSKGNLKTSGTMGRVWYRKGVWERYSQTQQGKSVAGPHADAHGAIPNLL